MWLAATAGPMCHFLKAAADSAESPTYLNRDMREFRCISPRAYGVYLGARAKVAFAKDQFLY